MPGGYYIPSFSNVLRVIGEPNRKQFSKVLADVLGNSGSASIAIVYDGVDPLVDSIFKCEVDILGIKTDGSAGYSAKKVATFRKDGAADLVQVGATNTVSEHRDDVAATTTVDSSIFSLRVNFQAPLVDVYRWTTMVKITQTLL